MVDEKLSMNKTHEMDNQQTLIEMTKSFDLKGHY